MRPITSGPIASVSASAPMVLDPRGSMPMIGLQLVVSGTNTSTVQVTADDVFDPAYVAASGNWFSIPAVAFVGATASQMGIANGPYTAVRLNMTAWTSGAATLRVNQTSAPGG